jgi:hypothetical protein
MPYSIAFVGYDGSGKTTIIRNLQKILKTKVVHHNSVSRLVYRPQPAYVWDVFTYGEISLRNTWLKYLSRLTSLTLDRCYICALVYSTLEGHPELMHRIKKRAFHPDVICLLEPAEEIMSKANRFVVEYQKTLADEGYINFETKPYPFGVISFWKWPELTYTPYLEGIVELIGAIVWQPVSRSSLIPANPKN